MKIRKCDMCLLIFFFLNLRLPRRPEGILARLAENPSMRVPLAATLLDTLWFFKATPPACKVNFLKDCTTTIAKRAQGGFQKHFPLIYSISAFSFSVNILEYLTNQQVRGNDTHLMTLLFSFVFYSFSPCMIHSNFCLLACLSGGIWQALKLDEAVQRFQQQTAFWTLSLHVLISRKKNTTNAVSEIFFATLLNRWLGRWTVSAINSNRSHWTTTS